MPQVGFEPTIPAGELSHTYALERAATGTGTVQNTVDSYNTVVSIPILYYNIISYHNLMGPLSCIRSVVERNIVMRRIPLTL